jgi:hypothetical protein
MWSHKLHKECHPLSCCFRLWNLDSQFIVHLLWIWHAGWRPLFISHYYITKNVCTPISQSLVCACHWTSGLSWERVLKTTLHNASRQWIRSGSWQRWSPCWSKGDQHKRLKVAASKQGDCLSLNVRVVLGEGVENDIAQCITTVNTEWILAAMISMLVQSRPTQTTEGGCF